MTMSKTAAQKLVKRVLAQAKFGDIRVRVREEETGNQRFGASRLTTNGDVQTLQIAVTATTKDKRHATVTGNRTDDAALERLVRQAEELAELSPPDPEHMPPLGKTKYAKGARPDRRVQMDPKQRAEAARAAIDAGRAGGLDVSGFMRMQRRIIALGDRSGLSAFHDQTRASLSATCRTPDATGSAKRGFVSHSIKGFDAAAVTREAKLWADRSKAPTKLAPGRYTVVLTADAVGEMLDFFFGALSHRRATEGRSAFAAAKGKTKLGQKLFDPRIKLWSDPDDRSHPSTPIARDGRPISKVDWVDGGVLKALTASRHWADKAGVPPHPRPSSIFMAGGDKELEALVSTVDKGVLVSRFWYNRMLEPRTILVTGLTRDGTFLIEGGKIARPVKNFRYNDSPLTLLKRVVELGKPQRAGLHTRRVTVVPPLVVEGFNFESTSDAV